MYVIVYNASKKEDTLGRVEYWLKKIQVFTRPERPLIFLVGTHLDELEKNKSQKDKLDKGVADLLNKYSISAGFNIAQSTLLSCVSGKAVKELKDFITQMAETTKIFPQVPAGYVQLANMLVDRKKDAKLLEVTWQEFSEWAASCSIREEDMVGAAQFMHDVGLIVHFHSTDSSSRLNDLVVLDPFHLVK